MNLKSNPEIHDIYSIQILLLTFKPFKLYANVYFNN